jgi:hypothetical protein
MLTCCLLCVPLVLLPCALAAVDRLPNVESHTSSDYSHIWRGFKSKDHEAQHIIEKVRRGMRARIARNADDRACTDGMRR